MPLGKCWRPGLVPTANVLPILIISLMNRQLFNNQTDVSGPPDELFAISNQAIWTAHCTYSDLSKLWHCYCHFYKLWLHRALPWSAQYYIRYLNYKAFLNSSTKLYICAMFLQINKDEDNNLTYDISSSNNQKTIKQHFTTSFIQVWEQNMK